jgi:hypothetical protein
MRQDQSQQADATALNETGGCILHLLVLLLDLNAHGAERVYESGQNARPLGRHGVAAPLQ